MKQLLLLPLLLLIAVAGYIFYARQKKAVVDAIPKTIIVGTSADFKPFSCIENGVIVGFDIDVMREAAQRIGAQIELRDMPFDLLIPQLQVGNIHVIAAGMTPTPERAKRILFSIPFLEGDTLWVVTQKNNPVKHLDELKGKIIVVNQGYTADRYMSAKEGVSVMRLGTVADALLALNNGRVFAFVTARNCLEPYFETHNRADYNFFAITDAQEDVALAISPYYKKLAVALDTALTAMKHDGTLESLNKKWKLS